MAVYIDAECQGDKGAVGRVGRCYLGDVYCIECYYDQFAQHHRAYRGGDRAIGHLVDGIFNSRFMVRGHTETRNLVVYIDLVSTCGPIPPSFVSKLTGRLAQW